MPTIGEVINLPPISDKDEGNEPRWVSSFWFSGKITSTTLDKIRDSINHCAHLFPSNYEQGLAFSVVGQMDLAIVNAAETIRPILQNTALPPLTRVQLISEQDAFNQLDEDREVKSYDVTQTAFAILGLGD